MNTMLPPTQLYTATASIPPRIAVAIGECRTQAPHRAEYPATQVLLRVSERGHEEYVSSVGVESNHKGELSLVIDAGEAEISLPMQIHEYWMGCYMLVQRTLPI